uniref:hypothetical protein n=1 Tax=Erythrobacter donghaensis TaxID=267135 RepID=UPI001E2DAB9F
HRRRRDHLALRRTVFGGFEGAGGSEAGLRVQESVGDRRTVGQIGIIAGGRSFLRLLVMSAVRKDLGKFDLWQQERFGRLSGIELLR